MSVLYYFDRHDYVTEWEYYIADQRTVTSSTHRTGRADWGFYNELGEFFLLGEMVRASPGDSKNACVLVNPSWVKVYNFNSTADQLTVTDYKIRVARTYIGDYRGTFTADVLTQKTGHVVPYFIYRRGLAETAEITNISVGETIYREKTIQINKNSSLVTVNVEYSIDGTSWKRIKTNCADTSFVYDFSNEEESISARLRIQAYYSERGDVGAWTITPDFVVEHNEIPTTPSFIEVPFLRAGRSYEISWGESTDADNDTMVYVLERAVNGGNYIEIYRDDTNSYTEDVPTLGWADAKYRIKAYDGKEYSDYLVSDLITIKYFAEFEILDNEILRQSDRGWVANNNITREIDTIHIKVNNELQEV